MANALVLVAISALILFIGLKWGVTAIHSGTVERARNPVLFWMVMAFAGVLFFVGLAGLVSGN